MIESNSKTIMGQTVVRGLIFLIFFLGIFVAMPQLAIYLLIALVFGNLALGFINGRKSIVTNITLLILALLLQVIFIEYMATLVGSVVSFVHLLTFAMKHYGSSEGSNVLAKVSAGKKKK